MMVQPTEDEGAPSERPYEAQPTLSPTQTSEVPLVPQTDSSPPHSSEAPFEPQTNPSPRPSPSTTIPMILFQKVLVGILEVSDQAKEIQCNTPKMGRSGIWVGECYFIDQQHEI
ncbi:hypothetical protein Tco_0416082 [Tanacetum coccineum]